MIDIYVALADAAIYVPVPCRGTIAKMVAVFQTNTVQPNDTIVASRGATAVNTLTATETAGLVVETGVPDTTNKGLIFDPASSTAANTVILLTPTGDPGASLVLISYDDSAYVEQT
jgi:hypothetical protein